MKVSIITITYNRAHLIGETIQSVLNQTYTKFEHIIIDDGSTDDTEEVVKNFNDERIRYFKYKRVANLSKLHNFGLKHSTGAIISILDSDDIWHKNKLELTINIFNKNNDIKIIAHNITYFEGIKYQKKYYNYENDFFENIFEKVLLFKILPFPVLVFKKEILEKIDYLNNSIKDGQQDFLFRIAANYKVYYISKSLSKIRIHNENTHSMIKNIPYFTNYYYSVIKLFFNKKISFILFTKGIYLNSKNMIKHLIR